MTTQLDTAPGTHFIVAVHIASGAVDYTWPARSSTDAHVFAAVQRTIFSGGNYRIEVRPVHKERRWWWEAVA